MPSPSLSPLRTAIAVVMTAVLALAASAQPSPTPATGHRQPVLVELFTSEGCSDCPPADALLAQLDATQFVTGAQAIVLSEHVTYLNHEGWSDPFSFEAMTERQQNYVDEFPESIQAIHHKSLSMALNNLWAAMPLRLSRAVANAAAIPKPEIPIYMPEWSDGSPFLRQCGSAASNTTLVVALAENATRSVVRRGENAGRTLQHVAVARNEGFWL